MGAIGDLGDNTFPDGPTGSPTEPSKAQIRQLFRLIDESVAAAAVVEFVDGGWVTATPYARNQALTHNDVAYRCIADHTSGSTTEPGMGASWQTVWEVFIGSIALEDGSVGNAKLANMTTASIKGRTTAGTGVPEDLSVSQVRSLLSITNVNNTTDLNKPVSTATQAAIDAEAAARASGDATEAAARAAADAAEASARVDGDATEAIRGGAGVAMHSIGIGTAFAALSGDAWTISWGNCRAVIGDTVSVINDLAKTVVANGDVVYIDLAGSTPYTAVKAASSGVLRDDFAAGTKLQLLYNTSGRLIGPLSDILRQRHDEAVIAAMASDEDLIYIGSGLLVPTEITPDREIVQGINRSTGLPIVGGSTPAEAIDRSIISITRSAGELFVHLRQTGNEFVRWRFYNRVDVPTNCDVWKVGGIYAATLSGGVSTPGDLLVDANEVEIALRRSADSGFEIGGGHGNDVKLDDPVMLIDGVAVDITSGTDLIECRRLEIMQRSQLYDTDQTTPFAKRFTQWLWRDGELVLSNLIDDIEASISFHTMYLAMLPIMRTGVTDSGFRAPYFGPVEDLSGAHSPVYTNADRLVLWGSQYAGEMEALEGWDTDGIAWIANASDRNKLYFSPIGGVNSDAAFTPAAPLSLKSRIRVSIKD